MPSHSMYYKHKYLKYKARCRKLEISGGAASVDEAHRKIKTAASQAGEKIASFVDPKFWQKLFDMGNIWKHMGEQREGIGFVGGKDKLPWYQLKRNMVALGVVDIPQMVTFIETLHTRERKTASSPQDEIAELKAQITDLDQKIQNIWRWEHTMEKKVDTLVEYIAEREEWKISKGKTGRIVFLNETNKQDVLRSSSKPGTTTMSVDAHGNAIDITPKIYRVVNGESQHATDAGALHNGRQVSKAAQAIVAYRNQMRGSSTYSSHGGSHLGSSTHLARRTEELAESKQTRGAIEQVKHALPRRLIDQKQIKYFEHFIDKVLPSAFDRAKSCAKLDPSQWYSTTYGYEVWHSDMARSCKAEYLLSHATDLVNVLKWAVSLSRIVGGAVLDAGNIILSPVTGTIRFLGRGKRVYTQDHDLDRIVKTIGLDDIGCINKKTLQPMGKRKGLSFTGRTRGCTTEYEGDRKDGITVYICNHPQTSLWYKLIQLMETRGEAIPEYWRSNNPNDPVYYDVYGVQEFCGPAPGHDLRAIGERNRDALSDKIRQMIAERKIYTPSAHSSPTEFVPVAEQVYSGHTGHSTEYAGHQVSTRAGYNTGAYFGDG